MSNTKTSNADWLLFTISKISKKYSFTASTGAITFIMGRLVNEVNEKNQTISALLSSLFSPADQALNWLSWLSVLIISSSAWARIILPKAIRRRNYIDVFEAILKKYRSANISHLSGLAWGDALSIQTCPDLFAGWPAADVTIRHNSKRFSVPEKWAEAYKIFYKDSYDKLGFKHDGVKLFLTANPRTFTDSPSLTLETSEALYSQVQYYKYNVASLANQRQVMVDSAVEGRIHFPHSLCMHAVIVTSDDMVLLTKRSDKVEDYPNSWSCSIEEQMQPGDLEKSGKSFIEAWAERMLDEELGVTASEYNAANIRIMSIFIETDILNISLCAHITIDISSKELSARLRVLPRQDYEFSTWLFVTHKQLIEELFIPTNRQHPSTGYRILFALIKRYGNSYTLERALSQRTSW